MNARRTPVPPWIVALLLCTAALLVGPRLGYGETGGAAGSALDAGLADEAWRPEQEEDAFEAALEVDEGSVAMPAVTATRAAATDFDAQEQNTLFVIAACLVVAAGFFWSFWSGRRRQSRALGRRQKSIEEGLNLPPSLHPVINASKCIGCGSCVAACPDKSVLSVLDNKAIVATASNCVGHGLCKAVCPVDAVTLVFGTEARPMDLPKLDENYQTSVPGLYVAGELGGMGLIANAFEQSILAVDAVVADLKASPIAADRPDLLVIGSGPAGLGAALRAKELGLSYVCVDQAPSWGGAILAYPRAKLVMTRPLRIPLYGPVKMAETNKEDLVALWSTVIEQTQVAVRYSTRVESITADAQGFVVATSQGSIEAKKVMLAIGNRGTPRKLGVAGDTGANVSYVMLEPDKWAGQKLVVVGGGDVACETALALAAQPGTEVSLLYRGKALTRPKAGNRARIAEAVEAKTLHLRLEATPTEVRSDGLLTTLAGEGPYLIKADHVFPCLGGLPPTKFLQACGIKVVTLRGEAMA